MDKKSTLCLWIDGIGLSSSWSGNAFMSANPKNFLDVWSRYRRTTVSPCFSLKSGVENTEIDFARVIGGESYLSDKSFLDQYIANDKLEENEELNKIIEETLKRNASVHLIGNIPSQSQAYSSFFHLESLLKLLHRNNRTQVYIHLILGDDLGSDQQNVVNYLAQYRELIKDYPSIETASVTGQNSFLNNNLLKKAVEAILFGRGAPALTLEQAFSTKKDKTVSGKEPTSIVYRDKFTFKIKNFDTVFFFNHNSKHLFSFMQLMTTELIGSLLMPKFLQIGTFFDSLAGQNPKINNIVRRKFNNKLLATLNGQYNFSIVADKTGAKNLSYFEKNSNYRTIQFDGYELLAENLPSLVRGENNFSLVYLNLLSKIISDKNFNEAEEVVKEFDKFFGKAMEFVLKEDAKLILFSSIAGLERLTNRNEIEKMSSKTMSPLPFIVVEKGNKKVVSSKAMFYDMIKDRQSIIDIASTIFDLLGIENQESSIGKSFNKEIK